MASSHWVKTEMINRKGENKKPPTISWKAAQDAERKHIAIRVYPIAIAVMSALGAFFVVVFFLLDRPWQWVWMMLEMAQAVALLSISFFLAKRGRLRVAIFLTTVTLNLTVIIGPALVEGMIVPGILASLIALIFARLLAGSAENQAVTLMSAVALVTGIALSGFQIFEVLPIPNWIEVVTGASGAVIVVILIALILDTYHRRSLASLSQAEAYANELNSQRVILEKQTHDLLRRTRYLEATAEVARDAASILDMEELLPQVVLLISHRFDLYHAGIFLLDPSREWAVLQAASSAGGHRLLARNHRLRVGQEGIVGYVTGRGQHRLALDVEVDSVFFDNPELPDTRSELALPLRARGEIIGALDVQSTEPEAFSDVDVAVLQTLADQVAMAISNARLFRQEQERLVSERRLYDEMGRRSWEEMVRKRSIQGYRFDQTGLSRLPRRLSTPHSTLHNGTESAKQLSWDDGDSLAETIESLPELKLPVKAGEHHIGTVIAHKSSDAGDWSGEEVELMHSLVEHVALALQNARFTQEAQLRAAQQKTISEITARIRETLHLETMLKTAADEIYQAMNLDELTILLSPDGPGNGPPQTQKRS